MLWAAAGGGGACGSLSADLNQVIALEVTPDTAVEEADTLREHAVALTGRGDSVSATIYWASFNANTLAVVDSVRGVFVGKQPGSTNIQARTGDLRSNPQPIHVTAAADTLTAARPTHDTVSIAPAAHDSLSDSLSVILADTITTPPATNPLANRPVTFAVTYQPQGSTVTLVTVDSAHALVTLDTVPTSGAGVAAVKVRYLGGGTLPDSVVVIAAARRAVGTVVHGSPITFVVRLQP
jgi:hypothetical protein